MVSTWTQLGTIATRSQVQSAHRKQESNSTHAQTSTLYLKLHRFDNESKASRCDLFETLVLLKSRLTKDFISLCIYVSHQNSVKRAWIETKNKVWKLRDELEFWSEKELSPLQFLGNHFSEWYQHRSYIVQSLIPPDSIHLIPLHMNGVIFKCLRKIEP